MVLPDYTTQDAATYKANIDSTAADHETRLDAYDASPIYGLVVLDTPEALVTTLTSGAWTTVNSTTLNTALANKAIIRYRLACLVTGTTISAYGYLRKTGSAVGLTNQSQCVSVSESVNTSATFSATNINDVVVNLDSNYDFDYYFQLTSGNDGSSEIILVGYYV